MPILPIDLQTLIGQIDNVSRTQQANQNNPVIQQQYYGHIIENKTIQNDNQVNQLQQTDNQDKKIQPDKKNKYQQNKNLNKKKKDKDEIKETTDEIIFKDPDKGNIIDIKK